MAETKYPIKSSTYKGVYQRKNGTWFYRAKRIVDGKEVFYQSGKFLTEKLAYDARQARLHLELIGVDKWKGKSTQVQGETFLLMRVIRILLQKNIEHSIMLN